MRELRASFDLYLDMKDEETESEAEDRLFDIIAEIREKHHGLSTSIMYDSEIQEYEE